MASSKLSHHLLRVENSTIHHDWLEVFFPPKGLKTFSKLLEAPKEFKQKWLFLPQSQSQRQQKRFFLLYLDFTSKTQAPLGALGRQRSCFCPRDRRPPSSLVVWLSVRWRSKGGSSSDNTKILWQYVAAARYNNYFIYSIQFIQRTWTKYSPYFTDWFERRCCHEHVF